ncbi:MAG: hypothetical protein ACOVNR_07940 [Chitinophagaceae bacterium]
MFFSVFAACIDKPNAVTLSPSSQNDSCSAFIKTLTNKALPFWVNNGKGLLPDTSSNLLVGDLKTQYWETIKAVDAEAAYYFNDSIRFWASGWSANQLTIDTIGNWYHLVVYQVSNRPNGHRSIWLQVCNKQYALLYAETNLLGLTSISDPSLTYIKPALIAINSDTVLQWLTYNGGNKNSYDTAIVQLNNKIPVYLQPRK